MRPAADAMFTTCPCPRATMSGRASRSPRSTPPKFTSICSSCSPAVVARKPPGLATPALFTSTSTGPPHRATRSRKPANDASSRTSRPRPSPSKPAARSAASSEPKSPMATLAPAEARRRATASPMPRAPPVTATTVSRRVCTATRPGRRNVLLVLGRAGLVVADRTLVVHVHVVDDDVDLGDLEPEQVLHRGDHLGAHLLGHREDHEAVLDDDDELDRGGLALQPYRHALVGVLTATAAEAELLLHRGEQSRHVAAEVVDARHLARRDRGDLLDDLVRDDRAAPLRGQLGVVAQPVDHLRGDPAGGVGGPVDRVADPVPDPLRDLARPLGVPTRLGERPLAAVVVVLNGRPDGLGRHRYGLRRDRLGYRVTHAVSPCSHTCCVWMRFPVRSLLAAC